MVLFLGFLSCVIDLCVCFCAGTTGLITAVLQYTLRPEIVIPPSLFFFLKIGEQESS